VQLAQVIVTRDEARMRGLKRYFTGQPCRHGHIAERTVSWSGCVTCIAIQDSRVAERNRARIKSEQPQRRDYSNGARRRVTFGFDKDPLPWPDDGGLKRVPIHDHIGPEPRLVRRVGWVNCLGRIRRHRFLSPDVVNCRICERCRGKEPQPIL
jgi:hypothetical protein